MMRNPEVNIAERSMSSQEVEQLYRLVDQVPREDVIKMIHLYPKWTRKPLTYKELGKLQWMLSGEDGHITRKLTQDGRRRSLLDVAKTYLQTGRETVAPYWDGVHKTDEIIDSLHTGIELPPIIIVPGDKYPNSPDSSFIDGVHRAFAVMVDMLEKGNDEDDVALTALVGEKAPIYQRALRKLFPQQPRRAQD